MSTPETTKHRLHPATILVVAVEQGKTILLALVAFLWAMLTGKEGNGLELAVALLGVLALLPAVFRYLTVRYEIGPDAFVMRSGMVFRQTRSIPLERIQNVTVKRNLLHRLLRVCSLQIETASGAGAEAELSVVGDAEAERVAHALRGLAAEPTPEMVQDVPAYHATPLQLLVAGATQNKAGTIVLFFFGLLNWANEGVSKLLVRVLKLPSVSALSPAVLALVAGVAILALFTAGWILSIASTFLAYFDFTLRSENGLLRLRHGLMTQLQAALPIRRIQSVRVEEPILQRRLGYCHIYADSAGSYQDKQAGGSAQLCPLLERVRAGEFLRLVFPSLALDEVRWNPVSRLTIRRGFVRYIVFTAILLGGAELFLGPWIFATTPVALLGCWRAALLRYAVLGYARSGGFVLARAGIWKRKIGVLPEDRIQWSGLNQTPFQRRFGLTDLTLVSASASGNSQVTIVDLPEPEARALQEALSAAAAARHRLAVGGL
jgi:putative membrane protein